MTTKDQSFEVDPILLLDNDEAVERLARALEETDWIGLHIKAEGWVKNGGAADIIAALREQK